MFRWISVLIVVALVGGGLMVWGLAPHDPPANPHGSPISIGNGPPVAPWVASPEPPKHSEDAVVAAPASAPGAAPSSWRDKAPDLACTVSPPYSDLATSGSCSPIIAPAPQPSPLISDDEQSKCRSRNAALGRVDPNPNAPCVDLSDVVAHLQRGTFKFNKPNTATLDEPFRIRLVLLTAQGQEASFDGLPGKVETRDDRPFAQSLEATLNGDDFEIKPSNTQARTATLASPVEWEWRLTPTSHGKKTITIEVSANIQIGTDKHQVQLTTLRESIDIQVTPFQRLKTYVTSATGMMTTVLAAFTSLAGVLGFVPKTRQFFKDYVLTLFRKKRRAKRKVAH